MSWRGSEGSRFPRCHRGQERRRRDSPGQLEWSLSSSPWPQWLTPSQTNSGLMQMLESHWKASEQPNVCKFLKAVMMRVKPLFSVPQLSVWYLSVTKLVRVMMNPLLPTELGWESQEMWACKQFLSLNISLLFSPQTWFIIWNFERVEDNALGLRLVMCRS